MISPEEIALEKRIEKARNLRYRKPIVRDLNLYKIQEDLQEIMEACAGAHWYCDSPDGNDTLLNALGNDESEALEFRTAFSTLEADAMRMQEDLENEYVPECFDLFFAGIGAASVGGGMLGYDEFEGDYFGLGAYETSLAEDTAAQKLKRMTKEQLLDAAGVCFREAMAYIGIRNRYDNLEAAMDILRQENTALLDQIRAIDDAYNRAAEADFESLWGEDAKKFDSMLASLPDRVWIE